MAKTDNEFNINGKLGNLIFFQRNGKSFVKKYAGGFVNSSAQQHPNTIEVKKRFKELSMFSASFKKNILPFNWKQKDSTFHNQLVSFFSTIKKETNQSTMYSALLEAYKNGKLQHRSLNKNGKLSPFYVQYNAPTNELKIQGGLVFQHKSKFPNAYLEISIGWLVCTEELELNLINFQNFYVLMDNLVTPLTEIKLSPQIQEQQNSSTTFPFIGISIVTQNNEQAKLFHPFHYTLTTFL